MLKFFLLLPLFIFISNCSPTSSAAFLGPVFTGVKTGSVYQTSISYGSNRFIKNLKKDYEEKKEKLKNQSVNMTKIIIDKMEIPPVLITLKIDNMVISEINEPEPLP